MSLHRALVQYDRLFTEAESIRIERDKLRAENSYLLEENSVLLGNLRLSIAENAEFKSHNEYLQGDAGLADMVIERLKAENAELRKLVRLAFDESRADDDDDILMEELWGYWSAQHPILKEQP